MPEYTYKCNECDKVLTITLKMSDPKPEKCECGGKLNRSFEKIVSVIDEAVRISDFESISLIGSCVSSHPKFKKICEYIINKGKRLSLPSIRIEHITPDIIHILEAGNIKTITIAPEAGPEDLRYSLGKKISNEKIVSVLSQIRDSKIKNVDVGRR